MAGGGYGAVPSDIAPDAEWEIWHQDVFDRECPRRVEVAGRGLMAGLVELWTRHLFETVGVDGKRGFARFNLWWKQEEKSVQVVGPWKGMVRLRGWIFGEKRAGRGHVEVMDKGLLAKVARVHGTLVMAGRTSEDILVAASCASREDFERQILDLARHLV